jgi:pyrrolidone-carboxylate peptidase
MKLILSLIIILFSQSLMAKSILLSGFDAFKDNPANNSEIIAKELQKQFEGSDIKVHYCQLRTVYYKSADMLKDCYHGLEEKPDYVISLGEGYCDRISFETMAFNKMSSTDADNDGMTYQNDIIRADGPKKIYLSLNLKNILNTLPRKDRKFARMSKRKIGSYVCNNLAYIAGNYIKETPFGFIHVPSHNCSNQEYKKKRTLEILSKTIKALFD